MRDYSYREVDMGEFGEIKFPEIIWTGGLGPCVGVGIYNQETKMGYIFHLSDPSNTDSIREFIVRSLRYESEYSKVHLCGAAFDSENKEEVVEYRRDILDLVGSYFNENQIGITWNDLDQRHGRGQTLTLDTETGLFEVTEDISYENESFQR